MITIIKLINISMTSNTHILFFFGENTRSTLVENFKSTIRYY